MDAIVEVSRLTKEYKEVKAVNDLSFSVQRGEVYGFLGQNGAGKSTTLRMLMTLIAPSSGTITMFGKSLRDHRHELLSRTGAVIEKPDLYKYLSGMDNLRIMARLSGIAATTAQLVEQLEKVGLADRRNSKVKTYSQGMKQRLGIACALVHGPELVVLDEPTNGLDPQGIADMRNLILHLSKNEGKTLIVSSHLLSEIEMIADSMLIIDKGQKVVEGRVGELLNPSRMRVELRTTQNDATRALLQESKWGPSLIESREALLLEMHQQDIPHLLRFLVGAGVDVLGVQPRHSLENYFLSLTSQNQHVAAYQH